MSSSSSYSQKHGGSILWKPFGKEPASPEWIAGQQRLLVQAAESPVPGASAETGAGAGGASVADVAAAAAAGAAADR
ncbi:hypothetical protein PGQ11_015601 [Apiospora arundinis]|uniref:Uncharacterized protein n=1 Tax=Apiospora arundinis TaxID=335852 RepID=A0ABR2HLW1_9PEZI